ncbi:acyl-CoA reductase [Desulforamulus aeronauticus]|uniref:Acyl-CoA reductase n=1 Tax=Desulforamulus aeronauticus DSM 10349 TaxID=1121421 RepID=A0A1M6TF18_9FIRM|nr:acyl-CoA reductase [Desulforamulus aeronauticus]SHK55563.1 Acyl-CoA reductase (LuxC) [Desulforamulus aeronauticus DSM 10349]
MKERAGYLPGISEDEVAWQTVTFTRNEEVLEVAVPVLAQEQMQQLAEQIKNNSRQVLKTLAIGEIVEILDKAVAVFLDRHSPYRRKAEQLLPIVTGYDPEVIRHGLTSFLKTFRKPQLLRFLAEDLGNISLLDDFQPRAKGGFAKAFGPDLIVHVWAGNVPALPLWSLLAGMLVKSGNIGKVASAEPLFAGWFANVLAEVEPRLAGCLAIVWWKGGDEEQERSLLGQGDVVVGYGSNTSLASLRSRIPVTTRFLPYGHKMSFGLVTKDSLDARKAWQTAHAAALDVIRYDQQGCYSPHFFYVQRGGAVSPGEFAKYLAHEMECFARRYPRRALSLEEMAAQAAWRQQEELTLFSTPTKEILGDDARAWTVVYEEGAQITPSCLNRTVKVLAVDQWEEILPQLIPYRPLLQTVGVASAPRELWQIAELLGRAGVTRITSLGKMTSPEAGWHHDGRFNLLDLINMVDIESAAEEYAERLAPYVD